MTTVFMLSKKPNNQQPTNRKLQGGSTMPEKSPETFTFLTYCWVIGLSSLGGAVAFIRKMKSGHARAFNFAELLGEIMISAFTGVMTFYLCEWSGFSPLATAAFVGIAGHMGSRALFQLEGILESQFSHQINKQKGGE